VAIDARRDAVAGAIADGDGILRLRPAWVARDFLPPGRRLGLPDDAYDLGERGAICERWLASTTQADNRVGPPHEGLSFLAMDGSDGISLRDAVASDPEAIMGEAYAATHDGLGRLAKIFDYGARLPLHLHQRQQHASLVGRRSKDEAYYFPAGVEMGSHPETFLGVHPSVAEERNHELLLPYLERWDSDLILQHSVGYLQVAEHGFHIPSGVLHAPGTALTIELQEDSDVFAMLQALNAGKIISKELLWKDVRAEDREAKGERFILELIDWEANGDPLLLAAQLRQQAPGLGALAVAGGKDQGHLACANPADEILERRQLVVDGQHPHAARTPARNFGSVITTVVPSTCKPYPSPNVDTRRRRAFASGMLMYMGSRVSSGSPGKYICVTSRPVSDGPNTEKWMWAGRQALGWFCHG